MPELPHGTVTFLATDIEGSTRRWERDAAAMGPAVQRHFALLRAAVDAHGGAVVKTIGDAILAAFATAPAATAAEGSRGLTDPERTTIGQVGCRRRSVRTASRPSAPGKLSSMRQTSGS